MGNGQNLLIKLSWEKDNFQEKFQTSCRTWQTNLPARNFLLEAKKETISQALPAIHLTINSNQMVIDNWKWEGRY